MSLPEIILLVSAVIASVAAVVQAWVAWKSYQRNHPPQRHNQGIDSRVSSPPKQASPVSSPRKKQINIPWGWLRSLAGVLLTHAVLGFLSAPSALALTLAFLTSASASVLTSALAGQPVSEDWFVGWVLISIIASALAWAWSLTRVWAWIFWDRRFMVDIFFVLSLILPLALSWWMIWTPAWNLADKDLLNSFSKFHTFLILLGTSWLGLGLGWLVCQIFPILR